MCMKKNFLWMSAAILTCGLTIASCAKMDYPTGPEPDPDLAVNEVDFNNEELDINEIFKVHDASKMTVSIVDDAEKGKVASFVRSGSKGKGLACYDFSSQTEDATAVKVSFDFKIPAEILAPSAITIGDATVHNATTGINDDQYGYTSNGAIFNIGATRGKIGGSNTNYFMINDQPVAVNNNPNYEIEATDIWGKWFHVDLDVNVAERTYTYVVTCGDEEYFSGEASFLSENALACTQLDVASGNTGTYLIANLKTKKDGKDANLKYANYTISYVDTEGNPVPEELKTTITRRGKVGDAITLLDADKANFANADGSVKYIYESDNAEGSTITEAGTEIKIVFKVEEAKKYKYVVNCFIEGTQTRVTPVITGEEFEGVKTTVHPALTYKHEGAYYTTALRATSNGKTFNSCPVTITGNEVATQGYIITALYYTKDESIVYYAEMEDVAKTNVSGEVTSWISFSNALFDRFSQGCGIRMADGGYVWTDALEAGAYDIQLYGRCDTKSAAAPAIGYRNAAGEVTWIETENADWGNAEMKWDKFENVSIPAGCSVVIGWKGTSTNISIDCVKIVKHVEAAE